MPGGTTKITYQQRKPSQAHCAGCNALLSGVPRANKAQLSNMPKTKKRPERPYGGVLCSKCMRATIKESIPK